jgi:predicted dehydrogenase
MEKIRVGIMGAGNISARVARGIQACERAELVMVAARDIVRAKALAKQFLIASYTDDYEVLLNSDVDAIYITTINALHYAHIKACLMHGKHVICEKPMVFTEQQLKELYELADSSDLVLMEAMKCLYLPTFKLVKEELSLLSPLKQVYATFCRQQTLSPDHWLFDPVHGGALRDVGSYVLSFVLGIHNEPWENFTLQQEIKNHVDHTTWLYAKTINGVFLQMGCSIDYTLDNFAVFSGENWVLKVKDFWKCVDIELLEDGKLVKQIKQSLISDHQPQVEELLNRIINQRAKASNATSYAFMHRIIKIYQEEFKQRSVDTE